MRCPSCQDEYEPHVRTCATCGIPLVPADAVAAVPRAADAKLGVFHPLVAAAVAALLERRGIDHDTVTDGSRVTLLVDRDWRDDVRAELALTWGDLVRGLPEDEVVEVLGAGGPNPGWYDPPRGGHVDRHGRLVVDDHDEDAEDDAARVIGPALLTIGAILLVVGWYVLDSAAVAVAGGGLALVGLFSPR